MPSISPMERAGSRFRPPIRLIAPERICGKDPGSHHLLRRWLASMSGALLEAARRVGAGSSRPLSRHTGELHRRAGEEEVSRAAGGRPDKPAFPSTYDRLRRKSDTLSAPDHPRRENPSLYLHRRHCNPSQGCPCQMLTETERTRKAILRGSQKDPQDQKPFPSSLLRPQEPLLSAQLFCSQYAGPAKRTRLAACFSTDLERSSPPDVGGKKQNLSRGKQMEVGEAGKGRRPTSGICLLPWNPSNGRATAATVEDAVK